MKKNEYAEVKFISSDGLLLEINDKQYFAAFQDFPFLYDLPISEVYQVEYLGHGDIRWENADIDLNIDILAHPEKYPILMHSISAEAAALFGRKGGSVRNSRKAAASRANGAKGGRPRKKKELVAH